MSAGSTQQNTLSVVQSSKLRVLKFQVIIDATPLTRTTKRSQVTTGRERINPVKGMKVLNQVSHHSSPTTTQVSQPALNQTKKIEQLTINKLNYDVIKAFKEFEGLKCQRSRQTTRWWTMEASPTSLVLVLMSKTWLVSVVRGKTNYMM